MQSRLLLSAALLFGAALPAFADEPCATTSKIQTLVHSVADLVVPLSHAPGIPGASKQKKADGKTAEEQLIELITSTVNPRSWAANGGRGTIDYHPLTMSFVVSQTPDVQEHVCHLLASLRRLMDVQVALEVRFISVGEDFFERIGVDFELQSADSKPEAVTTGFLDEKQMFALMQAIQGDARANVMQAPKMTLLNGQQATLDVSEQKPFITGVVQVESEQGGPRALIPKTETKKIGTTMTLHPAVTTDRHFVRLYFKMDDNQLATGEVPQVPVSCIVNPQTKDGASFAEKPVVFTQFVQQPTFQTMTVEKTVAIPVGQTVVFGGLKKMVETQHESCPPLLSKVPYVNRLFKNVGHGREAHSVFVAITPRIIVAEEEQEQKGGAEESKAGCAAARCKGSSRQAKLVAELVQAYEAACTKGRLEEAEKLARAALMLDPACFARPRP
jgi:general secretion pathway protein D